MPYGVGKAASDQMAADMAIELKPHNITSLSICPGIVGTELMTKFAVEMGLGNKTTGKTQAEAIKDFPLQFYGVVKL